MRIAGDGRESSRVGAAPSEVGVIPLRSFRYYPGKPQGYAGYTDHVAMNCELNDSLIGMPPADQFRLAGFGIGFVEELLKRTQGKGEAIFHVETASGEEAQYIGWLSRMQEKGTDNAAPSTANLASALRSLTSHMRDNGAITVKYWDASPSGDDGVRDRDSAEIALLIQIFDKSQNDGGKLARQAKTEEDR